MTNTPMTVSFSEFTDIHQTATVAAGSQGQVFYFRIPTATVGFIYDIGNNWFQNTTSKLVIDGTEIYRNIERVIGDVDQPRHIDPPFLVRRDIQWYTYNNDTSEHTFEAMIDGVLMQKRGN